MPKFLDKVQGNVTISGDLRVEGEYSTFGTLQSDYTYNGKVIADDFYLGYSSVSFSVKQKLTDLNTKINNIPALTQITLTKDTSTQWKFPSGTGTKLICIYTVSPDETKRNSYVVLVSHTLSWSQNVNINYFSSTSNDLKTGQMSISFTSGVLTLPTDIFNSSASYKYAIAMYSLGGNFQQP